MRNAARLTINSPIIVAGSASFVQTNGTSICCSTALMMSAPRDRWLLSNDCYVCSAQGFWVKLVARDTDQGSHRSVRAPGR
jgi:hypothetical protein